MTLLFIGTTELLLIGGVALLFFGGKKLPEMMRGLGQGVRQFKEGMNEIKNADSDAPENAEETEANEQHHGESDKNKEQKSKKSLYFC